MKQAAQKKRKVFRTLIRIIHVGGKSEKSIRDDSHLQKQEKRMKSSQASLTSFSESKYENMQ